MDALEFSAFSDLGSHLTINSDAYAIRPIPEGTLLIIGDNVGLSGGEAAQYAVHRVAELWAAPMTPTSLRERLRQIILQVNHDLYQQNYAIPGNSPQRLTSLLVALVQDKTVMIAWVGHCQAYVINAVRKQALQITQDHSQAAEMVRLGQLSPAEYQQHELRGALTRVLGSGPYVDIDINEGTLEADDRLLICTDGLTRCLTNADLVDQVMKRTSTVSKVRTLVSSVKQRGGDDNATVILGEPRTRRQIKPAVLIMGVLTLIAIMSLGILLILSQSSNSSSNEQASVTNSTSVLHTETEMGTTTDESSTATRVSTRNPASPTATLRPTRQP